MVKILNNGNFQKKEHYRTLSGVEYLLYLLATETYINVDSRKDSLFITYKRYRLSGFVDKKGFEKHGIKSNWYKSEFQMKKQMLKEFIKYLEKQ